MLITKERGSDLERLTPLLESGAVVPSIHRSYALEQASDAMGHLVAGQVRGKVAITL
jgi:NADPH:quinone reductase-like Zn-dependent oxidoreductase